MYIVLHNIKYTKNKSLIFLFSLQIIANEALTFTFKVKSYFLNVWNRFDVCIYLMFIIAASLRMTLRGSDFTWARVFYAITLCLYFVRFMHVFFVEKNIGPKVIMISRMVNIFYILFILIFRRL